MMPELPVAAHARPAVLCSGVPGLDHVLGGGIVRGSSVLIDGPPGSGKSTLGLRLLHEGMERHGEPGLMLAFEEFPRQVHQAALDAGIDLRAHEEAGRLRILWTSPQRILEALQGGSDLLERVMQQMGARRVLVDSITHFRRATGGGSGAGSGGLAAEGAMREVLGAMLQQFKLRGVTTILVKELDGSSPRGVAYEEYLVDTSIRLHHSLAGIGSDDEARYLEVRKARGLANASGLHPFELGPQGPRVHVRWHATSLGGALPDAVPFERRRLGTGVPGLDAALGGGLMSGTFLVVEGDSGSGRSTLLLHALLDGLRTGERAAAIVLRDGASEWIRRAAELGADAAAACERGDLILREIPPGAARLERAQDAILQAVLEPGVKRIVLDGLADLCDAGDSGRAEMAMFLSHVARRTGALVVATSDRRQRSDLQPEDPVRATSDCAIVLLAGLRPDASGIQRRLLVLKHRGSAHALDSSALVLGREGLSLGDSTPITSSTPVTNSTLITNSPSDSNSPSSAG